MKELNVNELRALIRLIQPLRALRDDVEKSVHLELYHGTADMMVRSLNGLVEAAVKITEDSYLDHLYVQIPEGADDRQKAAHVLLGSGQVLAYLESQTGVPSITGRQHYQVQTAPNIDINMGDVIGGQVDRVMDVVKDALDGLPFQVRGMSSRGPKPPKPPKPPKGPKPPKPPRPPMPPGFSFEFTSDEPFEDFEEYDEDDEDDEE